MKMRKILLLVMTFVGTATMTIAQELPRKVNNVKLLDLSGKSMELPYFGEKNLMIFYVDPQAHKQNHEFTVELEESHRAESPNIYGFGVLNLKDAWYPNSMVRAMARKRTEKNGALVLADQNRILRKEWNLGDCNDQFVLLFINKEGELVFMHKGILSENAKAEFFAVIDQYK